MGTVQSVYRSYQEAGTTSDTSYKTGDTPLHVAARIGSLEAVQHIISDGGDCNARNDSNSTPLHCAALGGHWNVVRVLLHNGANVNAAEKTTNATPLYQAVVSGNLDTVRELLFGGADINGNVNSEQTPGSCALLYVFWDIFLLLVENGLEVNKSTIRAMTDNYGNSPLHSAARDGHWPVVSLFLDAGADIHSVNSYDYTPLHLAAEWGHMDVVNGLLSAGADCNATTLDLDTPLQLAVAPGHWNVVQVLLSSGASVNTANQDGNTPLHQAAEGIHLDMVTGLVSAGGNPQSKNKNCLTPLHYASRGDWNLIQVLLDAGAKVNEVDENGNSPLHEAAQHGSQESANALLLAGADSCARNAEGKSALVLSISERHWNVMILLVDNGASLSLEDTNSDDNWGSFPLHNVVQDGPLEALSMLLSAGADSNIRSTSDENTPLHCAALQGNWHIMNELLSGGADVNLVNSMGNSPLHNAAMYGHLVAVTGLLQSGAECNIANTNQSTPLHEASCGGHWNVMQVLLNHGADINSQTDNGSTPLHNAVQCDDQRCVRGLLSRGADCNSVNSESLTPLNCAASAGHNEILQLLLDSSADVHMADNGGNTPLHSAVSSYNRTVATVAKLVSAGADCFRKNSTGLTPVDSTLLNGNFDILEALVPSGTNISILTKMRNRALYIRKMILATKGNVNAVNDRSNTALHNAVEDRDVNWVLALLSLGADCNATNSTDSTPFNYLRSRWDNDMEVSKDDVNIMQSLLHYGANVDTVDSDGNTPLHNAVLGGFLLGVRLLVSGGADRDVTNKCGLTAMDYAVIRNKWDILRVLLPTETDNQMEQSQCDTAFDIERLLLSSGVNVNVRNDNEGCTALHNAVWEGARESIRGLILAGADCNIPSENGWPPLHSIVCNKSFPEDIVQLLFDNGADVNAVNNEGDTALHVISDDKVEKFVRILITAGGNIHATNNSGRTPLHAASNAGWTEYMELLIGYGANVNVIDDEGNTCLHLAVKSRKISCVKLLLSAGSDLLIVNGDGLAPLDIPAENCYSKLNLYLESQQLLVPPSPQPIPTLPLAVPSPPTPAHTPLQSISRVLMFLSKFVFNSFYIFKFVLDMWKYLYQALFKYGER